MPPNPSLCPTFKSRLRRMWPAAVLRIDALAVLLRERRPKVGKNRLEAFSDGVLAIIIHFRYGAENARWRPLQSDAA